MNANEVAVHEVDGLHRHMIIEGLIEGDAAPGAESDRLNPALASPAHRKAAALLAVYLSRVDFLKDCGIATGNENLAKVRWPSAA